MKNLQTYESFQLNEFSLKSTQTRVAEIADMASDERDEWFKGDVDEFDKSDDRVDFVEQEVDKFFQQYFHDKKDIDFIEKNRTDIVMAITAELEEDFDLEPSEIGIEDEE